MSYKDEQKATRESLKPRVIEQHWGSNRRQRRSRVVTRLTRKDSKHVVNDYRDQR